MVFSPGPFLFSYFLVAFFFGGGGVGGASLVAEEGHCSSSQSLLKQLGFYLWPSAFGAPTAQK